jgi:WD40 repeat protein
LWVVATVRIEFLREFLDTPYAGMFGTPMALGTLVRSDLATVIEEPGRLGGMEFAPGLVGRIVDDTGTSDALPLLAYLLQELYFAVGRGKTATVGEYTRLGGVAGALSRQADQVVEGLHDDGIESISAVLLRFVTIDGDEATRRPVDLADLTVRQRRIVDAFVEARLLVTGLVNGGAIAQVAHEALFRQWGPLRQVVEARAEQLRQRAELERWAADWERSGRKTDYLLTGERLRLALQWLDNLTVAGQATAAITGFVDQSRRRDVAFLRQISERIGEHVLTIAERSPQLALLLSLAALSECPPTPVATRALMAALAYSHLTMMLTGHTDAVRNLAWSPDGRRIATASHDGTARIWDAASGATVMVLSGHADRVQAVAWSPDAVRLATASRDQTVRIWDAPTGKTVAELTEPTDHVRCVDWSPDGRWLAAGCRDQIVRIWDADTFELTAACVGHAGHVRDVAFCPDGTRLATGSHDWTVRIWDLASGTQIRVLDDPEDSVQAVTWSPDGTLIAAACSDQTARIWDAGTGRQLWQFRGHHLVWNVAFSPDGRHLASCGRGRSIRVRTVVNGQDILILHTHDRDVYGLAWSPDGAQIATASADGAARIWDAFPRGAEETLLTGHHGAVRGAAATYHSRWNVQPPQAGLMAATCSDDRTVRLWRAATGEPLAVLEGHEDGILGLACAQRLLTCSSDKTVRLWDLGHGTRPPGLRRVIDHDDVIPGAVAWAPDDPRFATAGRDG